jgi:hypothetical protein
VLDGRAFLLQIQARNRTLDEQACGAWDSWGSSILGNGRMAILLPGLSFLAIPWIAIGEASVLLRSEDVPVEIYCSVIIKLCSTLNFINQK